jgi:Tfp pilus assembly protein PilN
MIEINLTPGASRKSKGRGVSFSLASVMGDGQSSFKDPFLLAAIVSLLVAASTVGTMHMTQSSTAAELAAREEQAVADSTRFAAVLRQRRSAEAKRDSVMKQLQVIKAIDADRFIWPHVMDEVSRALPPYTWLTTLTVTSQQQPPAGTSPAPAATPADSTKPPAPAAPELPKFRLVCNTVDIQAMTRFMKLLEASPFIQNVQLARSEMAMVDGKEVTAFVLEAQYERPDSSMIITTPVSLSVR